MTVADILAQSSNVGTIKIATQLGKDRFDHYLDAFGFGQPTGARPARRVGGLARSTLEGLQRHEHGLDADRLRHRGHRRCRCSTCTRRSPTTGWPARPGWSTATVDADGKRHDEPLRRAAPGGVGRRPPTR